MNTTPMQDAWSTNFAAWMVKVDAHLLRRVGLTSADLADVCYSDWFDDGITPGQAAKLARSGQDF